MKTTRTTLADLAAVANHEHVLGEEATRKGVLHYRAAGAALLEAKKRCGHGKFRTWVEANVCFSYRTARAYMLLAKESGAEWQRAASLRDALDLIANGKTARRAVAEWMERTEGEGTKYNLRATVTVASDTDPGELADLIRAGQVHWVLKNGRNKTLAVVRVDAVASLKLVKGN